MRTAVALLLLVGCSSQSLAILDGASEPDASSPLDSSDVDAAIPDDASSFDAPITPSDSTPPDAFVPGPDANDDASVLGACSVVRQTGCEAIPDAVCRFSGGESTGPGNGYAGCVATGSLGERESLPTGVCYTRTSDGRYFDLCARGLFCAGEGLGCRRYCDPAGAPCPRHGTGCGGAGCPQACNTSSTPTGHEPYPFPGGVGSCEAS